MKSIRDIALSERGPDHVTWRDICMTIQGFALGFWTAALIVTLALWAGESMGIVDVIVLPVEGEQQ